MVDKIELEQRLRAIDSMCQKTLNSGRPMLTYDFDLLLQISAIATSDEEEAPALLISEPIQQTLDHVIISCDASITQNPGGRVAVGVVIQYKTEDPIEVSRIVRKSTTINQGEYDAIYFGLTHLMALKNNPQCKIVVRSDSQIVINQLNGVFKCNEDKLRQKKENILELASELPVPVVFEWWPRNSTHELKRANDIAQELNGVKVH